MSLRVDSYPKPLELTLQQGVTIEVRAGNLRFSINSLGDGVEMLVIGGDDGTKIEEDITYRNHGFQKFKLTPKYRGGYDRT